MNYSQRTSLKIEGTAKKNWGETFDMISWFRPEVVQNAKVMVVGAGALGNEVLKNLALLGVGNIVIVDFDTIEYSNLSRSILFREADCVSDRHKSEVAAERVREINPNVKTKHIHGDIWLDVGLGVFRRMDVVIGCLDNRLARKFINRHCYMTGKTWIDGAIENLAGQLDVYKPWVTCYECQLTETEERIIQMRMGCPDIAVRNSNFGRIPTTPISSSIIGALQVQEALKVIHHFDDKVMSGQQFKFEGMNNMILLIPSLGLKEHCESHVSIGEVVEANNLSAHSTVEELTRWLMEHFGTRDVAACLDYQVILEIYAEHSDQSYQLVLPKPHFSDAIARQYQKVPGEGIAITDSIDEITPDFKVPTAKLYELGIPPLQILAVRANGQFHYVELTGDENFLSFER